MSGSAHSNKRSQNRAEEERSGEHLLGVKSWKKWIWCRAMRLLSTPPKCCKCAAFISFSPSEESLLLPLVWMDKLGDLETCADFIQSPMKCSDSGSVWFFLRRPSDVKHLPVMAAGASLCSLTRHTSARSFAALLQSTWSKANSF